MISNSHSQLMPLAAALTLVIGIAGCGRSDGLNRVAVSGRVTLNGAPLNGATIAFCPTGSTRGPLSTTAVTDGKFAFTHRDGPVAGHHKIYVRSLIEEDEPAPGEPIVLRRIDPIPVEYHDATILTVEITAGSTRELEFHLKSNPVVADAAGAQ